MKVLKLSRRGRSAAIPEIFLSEKRYAIFHGAAESSGEGVQSFRHCLWLGKKSFPLSRSLRRDCWSTMEYSLFLDNANGRDDLGNINYVLGRPRSPVEDGVCICLLDMYEGAADSTATLHSYNEQVSILGKGVQERPMRLKSGGAKRLVEDEYPALLCQPGAELEWTVNRAPLSHDDYKAEWDGENFLVTHQALAVTDLMERLHLSEQAERQLALRWRT